MPDYRSPNLGLNEPVLTVSQLNTQVKKLLNSTFPLVVVEGEISGLHHHRSSGHYYFNLKDERAVLRCVMFSSSTARLSFQPKDGLKVLVRAEISLYERDGRYQAVIQHMEPHGEGELRLAFEKLRAELQAKGWFEIEIKKPLPAFPKHIVVVSSPKGAATRDVFVNIWRRYPSVKLTLQPTSVQGELAVSEICHALTMINRREMRADLAILTRGGGSLEDLAAFNSESVAQAIFASEVPIVSAVGHDVDFTIADFVADLRAPTPSTAAELVTPDGEDLRIRFDDYVLTIEKSVRATINRNNTIVAHVQRRLRDPQREIENLQQKLGDRIQGLKQTKIRQLTRRDTHLTHLQRALNQAKPRNSLQHFQKSLRTVQERITTIANVQNREYGSRLQRNIERLIQLELQNHERTSTQLRTLQRTLVQARPEAKIEHFQTRVESTKSRVHIRASECVKQSQNIAARVIKNLEAVSPLAVLNRGYAVVAKPRDGSYFGTVFKSVDQIHPGDRIETHVSDGTVYSSVTDILKRDHSAVNKTSKS